MLQEFESLRAFVTEMNFSNSTNHKVEILKKFKDHQFIRKVLYYTYTPYKQYGVSADNLKKRSDLRAPYNPYSDLFQLLDDLHDRNISGHHAIQAANSFLSEWKDYSDLIYQIFDRNLETRATTTLINRVMPKLIPNFSVALAHDINKVKKIDLFDGTWKASRKIDGIRCLTVISAGKISCFSRNGKEFETLDTLKEAIVSLGITNCVLDGELCLLREDGSEDFQGILKEIQRKNHTIQNPKYLVFDILTLEEFGSAKGEVPLSHRLRRLTFSGKTVEILPQFSLGTDPIVLTNLKQQCSDMGWEGLIARRDVGYEGERTRNMLKIKEMHDSEYEVKELIFGPQRVIINGAEVEEEMLSAVIIEHRGNLVHVGSGFSLEERREYFNFPDRLIGSQITVQYFEESVNENGEHSLRFPVFKANHGKSRQL